VAPRTCRFAWTTRRALPTCPQQKQQTKKTFEPRFKIDHAASPMPETDSQNASRPGRHQIGTVGEIISESWARSNRYTWARSSESATKVQINRRLNDLVHRALSRTRERRPEAHHGATTRREVLESAPTAQHLRRRPYKRESIVARLTNVFGRRMHLPTSSAPPATEEA
jgi:hypothetical protein